MKKKSRIMLILCITLCIMTVGFAAFSTTLTITGTADIASTWKVVFTNIEQISKTSGVTIKSTPTASGTTATFNVGLTSPGDKIEYKITVANQGTLGAIINDIEISETGNDAIIFELANINQGDILEAGNTTTFDVTIEYNPNVTSQPGNLTNTLTVTVNYLQYVSGNGGGSGISVVFSKETPTDITFTSQEDISTFKEVRVNNKTVDSSNYTVTSGSTIITLKKEYLRTLQEGNYTIEIVSTNGTTSATFGVSTTKPNTNLVEKILNNNEVYADNIASKYITNTTGIDFSKISSNTNGKGLYYTSKNTEGNQTTYYFRGAVDNNYVKFGKRDTCEYNGTSVLYSEKNGISINFSNMPTEEQCVSKNLCDLRLVQAGLYPVGLDQTTCQQFFDVAIQETSYGEMGFTSSMFACQYDGIPILGMDPDTGEPKLLTESECLSSSVCLISEGDVTIGVAMTNQNSCLSMEGQWLNDSPDVYNESFPYVNDKATYKNNAKDIIWRIVRINEDGSVRIVTEEVLGHNYFNSNDTIGYMSGTAGSNNSTIKSHVDNIYTNSSNLSGYANYLEDAGFCNDRSIVPNAGNAYTHYGAYNRLYNLYKPQFKCPNASHDLFTMNTSSKGNKILTYPIGLLTADEIAYAGAVYGIENKSMYLNSGFELWTMSPSGDNRMFSYNGRIFDYLANDSPLGVRPVINLKSTVQITRGNGTYENPYVIKTN